MKKLVISSASALAVLAAAAAPTFASEMGQDPIQVRDQFRMIALESAPGGQVCEYTQYKVGQADPLLVVHYTAEDNYFAECERRSALAQAPVREAALNDLYSCTPSAAGREAGGLVVSGTAVTSVSTSCPLTNVLADRGAAGVPGASADPRAAAAAVLTGVAATSAVIAALALLDNDEEELSVSP